MSLPTLPSCWEEGSGGKPNAKVWAWHSRCSPNSSCEHLTRKHHVNAWLRWYESCNAFFIVLRASYIFFFLINQCDWSHESYFQLLNITAIHRIKLKKLFPPSVTCDLKIVKFANNLFGVFCNLKNLQMKLVSFCFICFEFILLGFACYHICKRWNIPFFKNTALLCFLSVLNFWAEAIFLPQPLNNRCLPMPLFISIFYYIEKKVFTYHKRKFHERNLF